MLEKLPHLALDTVIASRGNDDRQAKASPVIPVEISPSLIYVGLLRNYNAVQFVSV